MPHPRGSVREAEEVRSQDGRQSQQQPGISRCCTEAQGFHMRSPAADCLHTMPSKFPGAAAHLFGKDLNTSGKKPPSKNIRDTFGFLFGVVPPVLDLSAPGAPGTADPRQPARLRAQPRPSPCHLRRSFKASRNLALRPTHWMTSSAGLSQSISFFPLPVRI